MKKAQHPTTNIEHPTSNIQWGEINAETQRALSEAEGKQALALPQTAEHCSVFLHFIGTVSCGLGLGYAGVRLRFGMATFLRLVFNTAALPGSGTGSERVCVAFWGWRQRCGWGQPRLGEFRCRRDTTVFEVADNLRLSGEGVTTGLRPSRQVWRRGNRAGADAEGIKDGRRPRVL